MKLLLTAIMMIAVLLLNTMLVVDCTKNQTLCTIINKNLSTEIGKTNILFDCQVSPHNQFHTQYSIFGTGVSIFLLSESQFQQYESKSDPNFEPRGDGNNLFEFSLSNEGYDSKVGECYSNPNSQLGKIRIMAIQHLSYTGTGTVQISMKITPVDDYTSEIVGILCGAFLFLLFFGIMGGMIIHIIRKRRSGYVHI